MRASARHARVLRQRRALALLTAFLLAGVWVVLTSPGSARADGPSTFSNTTSISIPSVRTEPYPPGPASPYPSEITVAGMTGAVSKVTVTFHNLTHPTANDIDAMVVAPTGDNLVVFSDASDANSFSEADNTTLTFDDAAQSTVPNSPGGIPSGSYKPTNNNVSPPDSFPSPAPTPSNQTTLGGAFTGLSRANGTWALYIVDDTSGDIGQMAGGWSLTITTEVSAVTTTTAVSSSDPTSTTGTPVTFSAAVRAGGSAVTSGTVEFTSDGISLGGAVPLDSSGNASLPPTSALSEGTHLIQATYSGATGFLGSNGTLSQRVDNATVVTDHTYCNNGPITGPGTLKGAASPYPSNIFVAGLDGQVMKVTATLKGLTHSAPIDFDILLSGPTPTTNLILLSDAGGQNPVNDLTVTFDDSASEGVPSPVVSGAFRPTDLDPDNQSDPFDAPAPTLSGASALATFNGGSANGTWSLWVMDDASGDAGSIAGGWCLTVTSLKAT
ncbi:MAG TPA: Ig-like domain-containing protein, partial [Microlunatus sp.]|nr:Ig-like domain-containing protein [Microlunatus sp.]